MHTEKFMNEKKGPPQFQIEIVMQVAKKNYRYTNKVDGIVQLNDNKKQNENSRKKINREIDASEKKANKMILITFY